MDALSSKAAAALIAQGVREADITASSLGIRIAYRYNDDGNETPAGHVASQDIAIIMRAVDRYADVVQALVDVGVSEISGVESDVSECGALRKQALAMALQDARERAGFLASEMGVTLGRVHQIGRQRTYWGVWRSGGGRRDGPGTR